MQDNFWFGALAGSFFGLRESSSAWISASISRSRFTLERVLSAAPSAAESPCANCYREFSKLYTLVKDLDFGQTSLSKSTSSCRHFFSWPLSHVTKMPTSPLCMPEELTTSVCRFAFLPWDCRPLCGRYLFFFLGPSSLFDVLFWMQSSTILKTQSNG